MAEDTPKEGEPKAPTPEPKNEGGQTFTQEQVNDLIAREKGKFQQKYGDYDEVKAKASELDQLKEANASELEKAQGKLSKAEERAATAEAKLLRFEVANEKKVPAEAVDLLNGSTKEDLEASADKILALAGQSKQEPNGPDFDGGPRDPAPDPKSPEEAHNDVALELLGLKPSST